MTSLLGRIILAFCLVSALFPAAYASKAPQCDLALFVRQDLDAGSGPVEGVIANLERELQTRGYTGRLRLVDSIPSYLASGESLISLSIIKSTWQTEKAFSVPYFLNRYRRVYSFEMQIGIPLGDGKYYANRIKVSRRTPVQAQVLTNDKYDPDLFPDQSDRIKLENAAYKAAAKNVADLIASKLK